MHSFDRRTDRILIARPRLHSMQCGKKYIIESFSECTGISNVVKVGWKSVPGGWTGVEEATFSQPSSCYWQNVKVIH